MRAARLAVPLALCCVAAGVVPAATAGPRPCIVDAAGDNDSALAPTGDPTADLLSIDVGTVRGRFTATVRLAALDVAAPVLGHRYDVYLTDGERTVSLTALVDNGRGSYSLVEVTGDPDDGASMGSAIAPVTGRLDAARRSIVLTVDAKHLGFGTGKRGTVSARSWRAVGTTNTAPDPGRASTYGQMDDSDVDARYTFGRAGCTA